MSINSQTNISLLINILESEFNRNTVRQPLFVKFFNDKLQNYHERRFNYPTLQSMNKELLATCYQYLSTQQQQTEKNTMVLKKPSQFQSPSTLQKGGNFDNYKQQYDTMLNPKKPKEIDFSDTIEDTPMKNIDNVINQTLEDRAKELERITNTYSEKPPDWTNPSETKTNSGSDTNPIKLIIEESPNSILKTTSSNKKVSFDLTTDTTNESKKIPMVHDLLDKLKLKQKSHVSIPMREELEKQMISKLEARVEAKFTILNEKYDKLRIKCEELEMKYSEIAPQKITVASQKGELKMN